MSLPRIPLAAAMWSVAIPGFGQLYNGKYAKGIVLIILEFVVNHYAHLNEAIYYSWLFQIKQAQEAINYGWLLFYPCMYVFAIFDAYHDCCAQTGRSYSPFILIPFIDTCFTGTVGVVWSSGQVPVPGLRQIGPIFFGALLLTVGLGMGTWIINRFAPPSKDSGT